MRYTDYELLDSETRIVPDERESLMASHLCQGASEIRR